MKTVKSFLVLSFVLTANSVFAACFSTEGTLNNRLCSAAKTQFACEVLSLPCIWGDPSSPPVQPPPSAKPIEVPNSDNEALPQTPFDECLAVAQLMFDVKNRDETLFQCLKIEGVTAQQCVTTAQLMYNVKNRDRVLRSCLQ